jgi:hypothetical protein
MPVAQTDHVITKSALRHRPISPEDGISSVPAWGTTTPRASRRAQPKQKTRKNTCLKPLAKKWRFPIRPGHGQKHWMVPAVLGMGVMIVLTILAQFAWSAGTTIYLDLRFGMPRTTQVDAYVGHEAGQHIPSHFIGENLRGQVVILEFPGSDAQHMRVLIGPHLAGPGADQTPVLLSFVDRHGKHTPDLLVQCGSIEVWYANEHGTFVLQ